MSADPIRSDRKFKSIQKFLGLENWLRRNPAEAPQKQKRPNRPAWPEKGSAEAPAETSTETSAETSAETPQKPIAETKTEPTFDIKKSNQDL